MLRPAQLIEKHQQTQSGTKVLIILIQGLIFQAAKQHCVFFCLQGFAGDAALKYSFSSKQENYCHLKHNHEASIIFFFLFTTKWSSDVMEVIIIYFFTLKINVKAAQWKISNFELSDPITRFDLVHLFLIFSFIITLSLLPVTHTYMLVMPTVFLSTDSQ